MAQILIISIILMVLLGIVSLFLLNIRVAVLAVFGVGISINYLYKIDLGPVNAFEIAGVGIPFLLVSGLVFSGKNIGYELNKDNVIRFFGYLLLYFLFSGVIFTGILYPSHTFFPWIERFTAWFKFLTGFIILLMVSSLFTEEEQINRLLSCILVSVIVPGAVFAWQIVTGNTYFSQRVGYSFADAYFHHPGLFAYYMLVCFPISLFKYIQAQNLRERVLWAVVMLLFLTMIFFTYRRGVWLGLLVQLATYFFILQNIKYKMLYGYLFIFIVILLSFTQVPSTFEDRFSDFSTFYEHIPVAFETNRYDDLFSGRWGFFKANAEYLVKQPVLNLILGNGIGAMSYASDEMGESGGGHNIYLILLVEFGLVSFLLYLLFMRAVFSKLMRALKTLSPFGSQYTKIVIAMFAGYLVVGMVTHVFYEVNANWVFWGMIGALLGLLGRRTKDDLAMENNP